MRSLPAKHLIALVSLIFVSSVGILQCTRENAEESEVVLLVLKTVDNPFFRQIEEGVRAELEHLRPDVELIVRAGEEEGDVSGQRVILEEFYSRYVKYAEHSRLTGVLLTPSASSYELTANIRDFTEKDIPVVLVDTRIDVEALRRAGTMYDVFVGSDNYRGGRVAAELILELLPSGGRVLVLNGVDGHETAAARRDGFREIFNNSESRDDFELVERTCNWRRAESRSTVDGLLSLGHTFDGIFAANDEMALGAAEAYDQHPDSERPQAIIGFDAIPEARKAVDRGTLSATLAQDPEAMGRQAVEALVGLWDGKDVSRDQVTPLEVVR